MRSTTNLLWPASHSRHWGSVSPFVLCPLIPTLPILNLFCVGFFGWNGDGIRTGFSFEGAGGILSANSKCVVVSTLYYLFSVRDCRSSSASASTFPLDYSRLDVRFGVSRSTTAVRARAPAVWGEEILPPLRLSRQGSTNRLSQPFSRFHIGVILKIIYFLLITAALIRESGRPSEMSRLKSLLLDML